MKKPKLEKKRLALNKEQLRVLTDESLRNAAGGRQTDCGCQTGSADPACETATL